MTPPAKPNRWDAILEQSAAAFVAGNLAEPPEREAGETPGSVVGRYRLIEEIGRGGMGAVWLAERADGQFSQRVALKLIKRGMDSDEILARFLRERQILARLEHPNIARLQDGGVSGDGRPYFVMEYVPGVPITAYCASRSLGVEERLRLFAVVCRAVQYAHRNLVVHRDLKPSNVLVTEAGDIKLLDFGVAKLLGDDAAGDATTAPGTGGRAMTPAYASPEQVRGGPLTTASDVYQLGVVLYELLTGQRPYRVTGRSVSDIERSICESQPAAPSATVTRVTRNRLRGDLDAIALRALRKEPEQRYPSAEAFAEDLERHLAHLPLRFGGGSSRYALAKFLRRHRGRLAVATLFLVTLATVGSVYLVQVRRERDRARQGEAKASETAALLSRFFQGWSPDAANRGEVTTAKMLNDAGRRAERELAGDPRTLAATLSVLGELHANLGESRTADSLLDRAAAIQERLPGGATGDLAATLARRGRLLLSRGRYAEAEQVLRRSLAAYLQVMPAERAEVMLVQSDLATSLWETDRMAEAETVLRAALGKSASEDAPITTELGSQLGYVFFQQGRTEEATGILRPVLERQRRIFGPLHQSTIRTIRALSGALRDQGNLVEAEPLAREAYRPTRTLFGAAHQESLAAMMLLAMVLEREGKFAEAEEPARESSRLAPEIYGDGYYTALHLRTLAAIRLARGDQVESERLLRQALTGLRKAFPAGHPDEGDLLNRLAYLLVIRGAPDAASMYREATAFEASRPAAGPWFATDGYEYLGEAARLEGEWALAERMFRRALTLYERQLPKEHPYRVLAATGLNKTLSHSGRRP